MVATVSVGLPELGLVTPLITTLTPCGAAIVLPPDRLQVATSPLSEQKPMFVVELILVSKTCVETTFVRLVPDGNVIVIWLFATLASPPVVDVLNVIT